MATSWPEELTGIEWDLQRAERALRDGTPPPEVSWSAPSDLGPVPPELRERARGLMDRTERVQQLARDLLGSLSGDLHGLQYRHDAAIAYATADRQPVHGGL